MGNFKLSSHADDDLEKIYEYTVSRYGVEQLDSYASILNQGIEDIAADPMRLRVKAVTISLRDAASTACSTITLSIVRRII